MGWFQEVGKIALKAFPAIMFLYPYALLDFAMAYESWEVEQYKLAILRRTRNIPPPLPCRWLGPQALQFVPYLFRPFAT